MDGGICVIFSFFFALFNIVWFSISVTVQITESERRFKYIQLVRKQAELDTEKAKSNAVLPLHCTCKAMLWASLNFHKLSDWDHSSPVPGSTVFRTVYLHEHTMQAVTQTDCILSSLIPLAVQPSAPSQTHIRALPKYSSLPSHYHSYQPLLDPRCWSACGRR